MNFRKFCFTFSIIMSVFLFGIGGMLLYGITYSNGNNSDQSIDPTTSPNLVSQLINPFSQENNKPVNILVLGGDKVNNNSDTIMVFNFTPSTAQTNIISIPRDTRVKIRDNYQKINAAYPLGGAKLATSTVSDLLGIDIKYFVFIDIPVFKEVVNLLGGVDFYVPTNMDYDDPTQNLHIHLKKGQQHLDGNKAEQLMRFRKGNNGKATEYYDGSDLKRVDAQQSFIKELIRQKANIMYISKANDIINVVSKRVESNLTADEALKMLCNIDKLDINKINTFKLPGEPRDMGLSYFIMNKEQTKEIVEKYFSTLAQ